MESPKGKAKGHLWNEELTQKIICVEEHIIDQDLARAAQPKQPYFTEVGPGYGSAASAAKPASLLRQQPAAFFLLHRLVPRWTFPG